MDMLYRYAHESYVGPLGDFEGLRERTEAQIHREFIATYEKLKSTMKELVTRTDTS